MTPECVAYLKISFWVVGCHFCDEFSLLQLVNLLSEGWVLPPSNNLLPLLPVAAPQSHSQPTDPHLLKINLKV